MAEVSQHTFVRLCSHNWIGHVNHSLFWQNLAPSKNGGGELPEGALKEAIDRDFGSLDQLKTKFNAQIAAIQGSGWGWLGYNPATGKLDIVTTANQDPLLCKSATSIALFLTRNLSTRPIDRCGRLGTCFLYVQSTRQ